MVGLEIGEAPVDRSKPDVGHLIHLLQLPEDNFPDRGARNLNCAHGQQFGLDGRDDPVDLHLRDRPLGEGGPELVTQLPGIKLLPAPVTLDHHQPAGLDPFISRKPAAAGRAFPAPADALPAAQLS
jgi:hypothetical protein